MKLKSIFLSILSAVLIASCTTDPCIDVTCLNDGVCNNGICLCEDWFEGTDCGTEQRSKYLGTYTGWFVFVYADNTSDSTLESIVFGTDPQGVNYIDVVVDVEDSFSCFLATNGSGDIVVPLQALDPAFPTLTLQGSGSFISDSFGNQVAMALSIDDGGDIAQASFMGSR
jgi:hypothetical protein